MNILRNQLRHWNARKIYYGIGVTILLLACMLGIYLSLREKDSMQTVTFDDKMTLGTDERVEEGYGFSYVYLVPGAYEITVCAKTNVEGAYFEIIDKQTNVSYAQKEYAVGEEYHTVHFTTDRPLKLMSVRSVSGEGELNIYGCTLTPLDSVSCTDAKRTMQLGIVVLFMLFVGVYRARYQRKPAFLIMTLLALAASLPFFAENIPEMHDMQFHLQRIEGIAEAIRDGQIPQRINTMFAGNGNITPMMYPQIFLIPGGVLVYSGTTAYYALRATGVLATFMTAYLGYIGGKALLGDRYGMLFAAFWVLNPFRLNEIFVRAAIGEVFALSFLPLVLAGFWHLIYKDHQRGIFLSIIGITGIISSHVLTTLLTALFCILLIAIRMMTHPIRLLKDQKRIGAICITGIGSLLINIWFLVPFLKLSKMGLQIAGEVTKVETTGVYFWQIFMDPSEYSAGRNTDSTVGDMSYSVGIAILFAIIVLVVILAIRHDVEVKYKKAGTLLLVLVGISIFLSTSWFPWKFLFEHSHIAKETLGNIQFPWRFLSYAALFGCLICTLTVRISPMKWKPILLSMLAVLTLSSAIKAGTEYFSNPDYVTSKWNLVNWASLDYNLREFTEDEESYVSMQHVLQSGDQAHIGSELELTNYYVKGTDAYISFKNASNEDNTVAEKNSEKVEIGKRDIYIPVSYYAGLYHAYLSDGTELETSLSDYCQYTKVQIPDDVQEGELRLVYEDPLSLRVSYWISVLSIIIFAGCGVFYVENCGRKRKGNKCYA